MSSKKQLDALGDRMKTYERLETEQRLIPNLPIYVRLDGRGFSKFTKGMDRPYDESMSALMKDTAEHLVSTFGATIGYVQSDEISLVFKNEYESPISFDGKKQKLVSLLAASASAYFVYAFSTHFKDMMKVAPFEARLPTFDCRVFNLPSWDEATNAVLWRYLDAIKNSKQMLAQHYFSHKDLQGLNGKILVDKLKTEKNIIWEDYPEYFKSGLFIRKVPFKVSEGVVRHFITPVFPEQPFHLLPHEDRVAFVRNQPKEDF